MAKRYAMEILMGVLIEYLQDFQVVTQRVWDVEEEKAVSGEVLEGANSRINLNLVERNMVHHYVLPNIIAMVDWVR
jgi:hypothetical protein